MMMTTKDDELAQEGSDDDLARREG